MYMNLVTTKEAGGRIRLTGPCVVTGKPYSVIVSEESARSYFDRGAKVQDAFPELSREVREFLISGTSPEGWKQLFEEPDLQVSPSPADANEEAGHEARFSRMKGQRTFS
jgi:hypothetical protein